MCYGECVLPVMISVVIHVNGYIANKMHGGLRTYLKSLEQIEMFEHADHVSNEVLLIFLKCIECPRVQTVACNIS